MKWRQPARRLVQVSVVGLLIAIPLLAAAKIQFIKGTLCAMGTDSFAIACPLGVLQIILASRFFDLSLLLSAVAFVGLAFVLGRVFCSWVCPQGFASEMADKARESVAPRGPAGPDSTKRFVRGRRILYTVLGVGLVSSLLLGFPILCFICPIGIIARTFVSASYLGTIGGEVAIVATILIVELTLARRGWCKYICPVGALYGLIATRRSLHLTHNPSACEGCHSCERDCSMGNSPVRGRIEATCTNCAVCVDICPVDALTFEIGQQAPVSKRKRLPVVR